MLVPSMNRHKENNSVYHHESIHQRHHQSFQCKTAHSNSKTLASTILNCRTALNKQQLGNWGFFLTHQSAVEHYLDQDYCSLVCAESFSSSDQNGHRSRLTATRYLTCEKQKQSPTHGYQTATITFLIGVSQQFYHSQSVKLFEWHALAWA